MVLPPTLRKRRNPQILSNQKTEEFSVFTSLFVFQNVIEMLGRNSQHTFLISSRLACTQRKGSFSGFGLTSDLLGSPPLMSPVAVWCC